MAFLPLTTMIKAFRASLGKVEQKDGCVVSELKIELPAIVMTKGFEVLLEVPNPSANVTPDPAYLARLSMSFTAAELSADASGGEEKKDPWEALSSGVTESLYGVYASKVTGMVYAVGKSGVILWSSDGEAFGPMTSQVTSRLHAAWGSGAGEVHVVGEAGELLRLANPNGSFTKLQSLQGSSVNGIAGSGGGWVYAVGNGGTIHSSGKGGKSGTWNVFWSGQVSNHLNAVWVSSTNRLIVVGQSGLVVVAPDKGSPQLFSVGIKRDLFGVWGDANAEAIYAVGESGLIACSVDGGETWAVQESGTNESLYGVWGSGPDDVYVVGRNGIILHSMDRGATWSLQKSGTTEALHAISGIGSDAIWIVGSAGTILRKTK